MFESSNVTVMVADLDRAVDFYTHGLGLGLGQRFGNEWAEVNAPGITIGLHPQREQTSSTPGGNMSIGFQVKSLTDAVAALRERGVNIDATAIRDGGVDRIVNFADPDGTPLYLIQMSW